MSIERIRVPDEDAKGWIDTLHQNGFSDEEVDRVMGHLNATYAELRAKELADQDFNRILQREIQEFGKVIIPEKHLAGLREALEHHYRTKRQRESPDAPLTGHVDE